MENKYYTPELNEFFDKFEYEFFDFVWKKSIFDFRDLEVIDDEIREDKIRVKHLDREDIESLGWHKHQETYFSFENKKIKSHSNEYFLNEILVLSNSYFLEITDFCIIIQDYDYEVIFKGTIKNKSELKKIMQMLNINSGGE